MTLYLDPSELKHELVPALATTFFEPGSSKLKANPDHKLPMLTSTAQSKQRDSQSNLFLNDLRFEVNPYHRGCKLLLTVD